MKIEIESNFLEHILNCLANQKYIYEQSLDTQKEWQEIIDKAYNDGRSVLSGCHTDINSLTLLLEYFNYKDTKEEAKKMAYYISTHYYKHCEMVSYKNILNPIINEFRFFYEHLPRELDAYLVTNVLEDKSI